MRWPRWLVAAITVLSGLVPAAAHAVTLTVTMPDTVTVGQTGLTAHVTLTNAEGSSATICNQGECPGPSSEGIIVIPSCASAATPAPTCSAPDPGVFAFAANAPILANSCGALVTSFGVVVADAAQGKLRLVPVGGPNPHVVLAPGGILPTVCDIPLTFSVTAAPALDAVVDTPGLQTFSSASADVQGKAGGAKATVTGRDLTTVIPGATTPPPPPPPPPSPAVPPPPPPVTQPSDLDHFKCYEALQSRFRPRSVSLRDQFGQRRTRVLRTRQLCNPVSKNGARILQPRAHLVCYETARTAFTVRTVVVTNQFGRRKLRVTRPNRLCVPSLKRRTGAVPATPNPARLLDHFRCYDVAPQAAAQTVKLADQFGTTSTKVLRVIRLCNPVRKNNEPVRRAKSHLVCYSIQDGATFRPIGVRVRNQFGRASLRIRRPESLCLPSFKEVVQTTAPAVAPPGLDHFKCYVAEQRQFDARNVGLRDQFGKAEAKVVKVRQLCNPVSKNAGRLRNRTAHLVCYETSDLGVVPFAPRDVSVSNQFGIRPLTAVTPSALCVPSLKRRGAGAAPAGSSPERVLDHFRCYDVKPQPAGKTVKLVDQFGTTKTKTLRVVRLCNPVSKNGGPIRRPRAHLVCYSIVERTFRPLAVTVRNQFGVTGLRVIKPEMLCLPSLKKVVAADGSAIDNTT